MIAAPHGYYLLDNKRTAFDEPWNCEHPQVFNVPSAEVEGWVIASMRVCAGCLMVLNEDWTHAAPLPGVKTSRDTAMTAMHKKPKSVKAYRIT